MRGRKRCRQSLGDLEDTAIDGSSFWPRGPESLEEMLQAHRAPALTALQTAGEKHGCSTTEALQGLKNKTIIVTSAYSGYGTFEMACHDIFAEISRTLDQPCRVMMYACTEIRSDLQGILCHHPSHIRPQHLFANVLGRLSQHDRSVCIDMQDAALAERELLLVRHRLHLINDVELREECDRLGQSLFDDICRYLHTVSFEETDECLMCPGKPQCFINPRRWYGSHSLWWEGAGTDCRPWSLMTRTKGGKPKWLSDRTLPCLVWLFSCRYYRVDRLFHENSANFPHDVLGEIFNFNIASQLRSQYFCAAVANDEADVPDVEPNEADDLESWVVRSVAFSPEDVGIPCNRTRRYSSVSHSSVDSRKSCCYPSFAAVFFRTLAVDAAVFFPPDWWQQPRQLLQDIDLSACDLARLEGHCVYHNYLGSCDGFFDSWEIPLAIADVTQEARFRPAQSRLFPTQMLRSVFWDLVRNRRVPSHVLWLAHGFPHPAATAQMSEEQQHGFDSSIFPALADLSYRSQQRVLGNSMHLSQISLWCLYHLG